MDQKKPILPIAQQQQQKPGRPRIRVRNILLIVVVFLFIFFVYGPSSSLQQDPDSPIWQHERKDRSWPGWPGIKHIFFFGDSYTSTRFLPQNAPPSEANPFGNPPFPGPVSHKRPLWSDYFVATYNQSFIKAINLAWGGATVDDREIVPFIDVIEGLNRQVGNNYLDKYAAKTDFFPWAPHDTLHVFWFGINDINGAFLWENKTEAWRRDLNTYRENVEKVYQTGARNFLFFNVPPMDRSPLTLAMVKDLQARKKLEIAKWNTEVFRIVQDFTKRHDDTTTFWWDAFKSYSEVLNNPCSHKQTCGLKDLEGNCPAHAKLLAFEALTSWEQWEPGCPYPLKEYFWMDELHHGYHMHDVTAEGVVSMLSDMPPNYQTS